MAWIPPAKLGEKGIRSIHFAQLTMEHDAPLEVDQRRATGQSGETLERPELARPVAQFLTPPGQQARCLLSSWGGHHRTPQGLTGGPAAVQGTAKSHKELERSRVGGMTPEVALEIVEGGLGATQGVGPAPALGQGTTLLRGRVRPGIEESLGAAPLFGAPEIEEHIDTTGP